jgi:hypothetical protein
MQFLVVDKINVDKEFLEGILTSKLKKWLFNLVLLLLIN